MAFGDAASRSGLVRGGTRRAPSFLLALALVAAALLAGCTGSGSRSSSRAPGEDHVPASSPCVSDCGYPRAATSGLAASGLGPALEPYRGPRDIVENGTVIEGKVIDRLPLRIRADNVTIRGNLLHGSTSYRYDDPAILVSPEASGTRILFNEIRGDSASDWRRALAGGIYVYASHTEVRGNDLSWLGGHAIRLAGSDDVQVVDNYVHDFTGSPGAHLDGIMSQDLSTEGHVVVRHNTVQMWVPGQMSGALDLPDDAPNWVIEDNLVAGGSYAVDGGGGGLSFVGNHFSTKFAESCGAYGTHAYMQRVGSVVWRGNVWHDGPRRGEQVALDG